MPSSDERWIKDASEFDENVLAEIYDALSPELYRYAYRLLGERERAEDVLGETFLRFLRALRSGGGPKTHVRAYLYRTLHNLAMDRHRKQQPPWNELMHEQFVSKKSDNPAIAVQQQLEESEARTLLWQLTPDQRQVIVLKYFQELSNTEIAAALKKSTGAVKALQHRGLASLRRLIEKALIE